jgi:hypothetical protein
MKNIFTTTIMCIYFLAHSSAFGFIKTNRVEGKSIQIKQTIDNQFYYKTAEKALKQFQLETFKNTDLDLDLVFLKIEKKIIYQNIKPEQLPYFEFQNLTDFVVQFAGQLKNNLKMAVDVKQRTRMQMTFFGLSQAIKKANQMNLTIQSDQFDKLHDILISQATSLFYASYKEKRKVDLFWCAYFLHELNYPMDLTAKHLTALEKSIAKLSDPEKYKNYGSKLAKLSLGFAQQVSKPTSEQVDVLYKWISYSNLSGAELQTVQRSYLKQIQLLGDSEKIKDFKKELATSLLYQESKNLLKHPLSLFKYVQFLIGYIFVAWPLEFILILGSLSILAFQASTVLTREEKRRAHRLDKKLWMMFTKSYLGANVPFFSKLAASLILFGVGLYFNSAKNFVESMISSM